MRTLSAYIDGISLLGPGLDGWPQSAAILNGRRSYTSAPTVLPVPETLPAAERRRTGRTVRLALALGLQAAREAGLDPRDLVTVFSSSGGDGDNCHEICQALASADRQISPTRFHNSVHNAPSGYWSIATGCMLPSTALCAYDASFAAGLLESLTQLDNGNPVVLLIAYDSGYPPPLAKVRPLPDALGVGLALSSTPTARTIANISVQLIPAPPADPGTVAQDLPDAGLEGLRRQIPAARALPMLSAIAHGQRQTVDIDYLDGLVLRAQLSPFGKGIAC